MDYHQSDVAHYYFLQMQRNCFKGKKVITTFIVGAYRLTRLALNPLYERYDYKCMIF